MGFSKDGLNYEMAEGYRGRPHKEMREGKLQCSTCKDWKIPEGFYPAANTYYKRETRCIECTRKRDRQYYNSDFRRYLTSLANAHRKPSNYGHGTVRRRKLHGESQVTAELLIKMWESQNGLCAITGMQMTHLRGAGHHVKTNVSIDRTDSNGGYTADNVRLVCKAANIMKYVLTDTEMVEWAQAIVNGPTAQRLSGAASQSG